MIDTFKTIVKLNQKELKHFLFKKVEATRDYKIHSSDGFLYCMPKKENVNYRPVCMLAHMDTVHKESVRLIKTTYASKNRTIISSPQGIGGDDRCGIAIILGMLKCGLRPHLLFCEDEEIGCVGAKKFAKTRLVKNMGKKCKFMIELDRRNAKDCVFYNQNNEEFVQFVEKETGFKKAYGTSSDICHVAPKAKISAVNLSCGYYKEHTLEHYVILEEMMDSFSAAFDLCNASINCKQFEYKENKFTTYGYWWDDDDYYWNYLYKTKKEKSVSYTYNYYIDDPSQSCFETITGETEAECFYEFMHSHTSLCVNNIKHVYEVSLTT